MTNIQIRYLGNRSYAKYNGFLDALSKKGSRDRHIENIKKAVSGLDDIDTIVGVIKKSVSLAYNTIYIITINSKEYYLSNKFEFMDDKEFARADFTPYIEFDRSNVDITVELKNLNSELRYKSSDEAIAMMENYCEKPPKSYKRISSKPKKISLYHSCNEEKLCLTIF